MNALPPAPRSERAGDGSLGWRFPALASAVALGASLLCGCSSFNSAWKQAGKRPVPANSMEGRWEGQWLSDVNGHNGALRCLISKNETNGYQARFRATYRKLLRFSYTVPLTVVQSNGVWHFNGEEDLGALAGGVYRYEGSATATQFRSSYRSPYDHGWFEMARPATAASSGD